MIRIFRCKKKEINNRKPGNYKFMKVFRIKSLCVLLFMIAVGCASSNGVSQNLKRELPKKFVVEVNNPLGHTREDVMVLLNAEEIKQKNPAFNSKAFVVMEGSTEIPSQYISDAG